MLRAAYWLSLLVYLPLGLVLYFFPVALTQALGLSPLWLARLSGALITAWSLLLLLNAIYNRDHLTRYALGAANLLAVATLVPAVLRGAAGAASGVVLAICAMLALSGVLALLSHPGSFHD